MPKKKFNIPSSDWLFAPFKFFRNVLGFLLFQTNRLSLTVPLAFHSSPFN